MKVAEIKNRETGVVVKMWIENETLVLKNNKSEAKCYYNGSLEKALEMFFGHAKGQLEIVIK